MGKSKSAEDGRLQSGYEIFSQGEAPCELDIVFVHGLRGHFVDTWSADAGNPPACWPRDFLKADVKNARIISWGYDANIDNLLSHASQVSLFGHARSLLTQLSTLRIDAPDRPILWVGHSLGGLVIKEALIQANSHHMNGRFEELGELYPATMGVIFLGTPHRGSDKQTLGSKVATIAECAFKTPNRQLLETLASNSHILEKQRDDFVTVSNNLDIVCFYEAKPMPLFGLIVPEASAVYDGYNVRRESIDANHSTMVKFETSAVLGYTRIVSHIQRMLRKKRTQQLAQQVANETSVQDYFTKLLYFDSINSRFESIQLAHESTFSWILDEGPGSMFRIFTQKSPASHFVSWLKADGQPIFWISGKAGSGKSTLMKWLYKDPRLQKHLTAWSQGRDLLLCRFFITELGDPVRKSREGMLRSILFQLLEARRELFEVAYPGVSKRWQAGPGGSLPPRDLLTWDGLKSAVMRILEWTQDKGWKVCLFVDGLDECRNGAKAEEYTEPIIDTLEMGSEADHGWEANSLISENCREVVRFFVGSLGRLQRGLKMCLSSREITLFEQEFASFPRLRLHEHTKVDIKAYSADRLSHLGRHGCNDDCKKLVDAIVEQSDGVFLWVQLVIDHVNSMRERGHDMEKIRHAINGLPRQLQGEDGLYMRMMRNLAPDFLSESSRVLRLAHGASHWNKLDAAIASHALELFQDSDRVSIDKVKRMAVQLDCPIDATERRESFRRKIKTHFGGLLECEAPAYKIEFVHKTAKDFLLRDSTWRQIYDQDYQKPDFDANLVLLAGHIMLIKSLGRGMIDDTGRQFGSSYIWAADAMHYAELVDSECTSPDQMQDYIDLVDVLDHTMAAISDLITECRASHSPGQQLYWPHFEPAHARSPYRRWIEGVVGKNDINYQFHDFLTFAAIGSLGNYVGKKLESMEGRLAASRADYLLASILFAFNCMHKDEHHQIAWLEGGPPGLSRYSAIGYRLGNPDMISLLLKFGAKVHQQPEQCEFRVWQQFLMIGFCCFSPGFSAKRSSRSQAETGLSPDALLHRDRVRWAVMLRTLLQHGQSPSELVGMRIWWAKEPNLNYAARRDCGLHLLLPYIAPAVRHEAGLESVRDVLEPLELTKLSDPRMMMEWDEMFQTINQITALVLPTYSTGDD